MGSPFRWVGAHRDTELLEALDEVLADVDGLIARVALEGLNLEFQTVDFRLKHFVVVVVVAVGGELLGWLTVSLNFINLLNAAQVLPHSTIDLLVTQSRLWTAWAHMKWRMARQSRCASATTPWARSAGITQRSSALRQHATQRGPVRARS